MHGLIVGGEDPRRTSYARELYKKIKELHLEQDITFTGNRSDMREIYAVSDMVLSLSKKPESFGRVVLEALSIGTPVVGYDHGGVGEILSDYFKEGLVSYENQEDLIRKVISNMGNEVKIKKNLYYKQEMIEKTMELYNGI